jgi:hypothetical protein
VFTKYRVILTVSIYLSISKCLVGGQYRRSICAVIFALKYFKILINHTNYLPIFEKNPMHGTTALSEWTTLSKVNSTYRVTYGDLHGDTRNFQGIIRMDKLWYSWSQSEVNVRDRIPRDHPRYSEKVVTFGLRTANVRIETSRERQGVILHPWHTCGSSRERFLLSKLLY